MSADQEVTREIGPPSTGSPPRRSHNVALVGWALGSPPRAFVLQRNEDETGVSGTGIVAEGVEFSDGTVALRWTSAWPTSVVFHDRGIDSVVHVHGHGGKTQVVFDDSATELRKLRRALVYWNYDHHTSDMLRDRIADVLERNADAIDQPYNLADAVLSAMHGWIDRLDQTLYDVIPPGDWGIVLECAS